MSPLILMLVLALGAIVVTSTNTDVSVCGTRGDARATKECIFSIICIIIFIIYICIATEVGTSAFSTLNVLP